LAYQPLLRNSVEPVGSGLTEFVIAGAERFAIGLNEYSMGSATGSPYSVGDGWDLNRLIPLNTIT
jgi:hypothetical protein